jgi:hypothetical protein
MKAVGLFEPNGCRGNEGYDHQDDEHGEEKPFHVLHDLFDLDSAG